MVPRYSVVSFDNVDGNVITFDEYYNYGVALKKFIRLVSKAPQDGIVYVVICDYEGSIRDGTFVVAQYNFNFN